MTRKRGRPPSVDDGKGKANGGAVSDDGWGELVGDQASPARAPKPAFVMSSAEDSQGVKASADSRKSRSSSSSSGPSEPNRSSGPRDRSTGEVMRRSRAHTDEQPAAASESLDPPGADASRSGWTAAVAGLAILALIALYVTSGDEDQTDEFAVNVGKVARRKPNTKALPAPGPHPKSVVDAKADVEPERPEKATAKPEPGGDVEPETKQAPEVAEKAPEKPAEVSGAKRAPVASGNPRAVPPNTPGDNARAFARIPVSPGDRPPIGGVGKTGIHIDRAVMGANKKCKGPQDRFSIGAQERANICFRVVHPREEEEVRVLWQKHGGTLRRSKLLVPGSRAYRTRAYLVLRGEYAGDWTVRIMSGDGVELASHTFSVVE